MKKGLFFGILGVFFVGLQPIIANARPQALDPFIFAAMTCLIEAAIFFPLIFIERKLNNTKDETIELSVKENINLLAIWKKNLGFFIFIGIIFGVNQLLFFIGYGLAGAINGSLTQKTTVFFGILFGFLILKEKVTKLQIVFSIILFLGLILAITEGKFNFLNFNLDVILGVITLLFITCLWMFGHTITKPVLNKNEVTATQMVFLRNFISGILLFFTYFIFFPFENIFLLFNPINQLFYIMMGLIYGLGLFCWYKTLSYLDVSKATIILSPTPIVTAIFATMFLGELFTIFHLLGTLIVILSIIIIVKQKEKS
ncbi:MAG: DMT family transporter [Promethearchaeota archaeon]|nr:MAG: DMT family transporter [Candidatus Lokiarchaeota archaeon]